MFSPAIVGAMELYSKLRVWHLDRHKATIFMRSLPKSNQHKTMSGSSFLTLRL